MRSVGRLRNFYKGIMCLVAFWLSACGPASSLTGFRFHEDAAQKSVTWQWQEATSVDNGASDLVNNDTAISCVLGGGGGMLNASYNTTGCVQQPAIAYSSRWIVGFPQIDSTNNPGFFSIFANSTSLVTNLFGTFANGLMSAISITTAQSARYVQFVRLVSGDIVAVFWVETAGGVNREVYANVYTASTKTWGSAVRLSTAGAVTDFGSDGLAGGVNRAVLCRPQVAASGDGSAMVAWCEGASPNTQIKYVKYSSGAWGAATALASGASSSLAFPGFSAVTANVNTYDSTNTNTFVNYPDWNTAGKYYMSEVGAGASTDYRAIVRSTLSTPSPGEFQIARDSSGSLLMCSTLQNLIQALLAYPVATGTTLSQAGISIALDSACSDSSSSTWNFTTYFNKSLSGIFRDYNSGATLNVSLYRLVSCSDNVCTSAYSFYKNVDDQFDNISPVDYDWTKSAMVAIAGDGQGNYAMARTAVSPLFLNSNIVSAGVEYGRMLVGHEYVKGSGWADWQRTTSCNDGNYSTCLATLITDNPLLTKKVSTIPSCYDSGASPSADYIPCSVKSPKFVMSDAGRGLVFFHQNQPLSYSATATASRNPNRLWVAAYSTGTGFASSTSVLDEDTFCNSSSPENDVPVCETGSYAKPCQTLAETLSLTSGLQRVYPDATDLDHDVPPIAARMNASGKAIIAFHKKTNSGTITSPNCTYYGVYARLYDPTSGFGSLKQLDSGVGDTMHAQVAINASGTAAVVWEEVRGANLFLIVREYLNGSWQTAKTLVEATTSVTDSMMPAVEIGDSDEILVSFSYGLGSGARRQYVRRLIFQ